MESIGNLYLFELYTTQQVEKIIYQFFEKFPTPQSLIDANSDEVANLIRPLGFYNRRTKQLKRFSEEFLHKNWTHAKELYGVGEYGSRAWEMLCKGNLGNTRPVDHALAYFYDYCISNTQ